MKTAKDITLDILDEWSQFLYLIFVERGICVKMTITEKTAHEMYKIAANYFT